MKQEVVYKKMLSYDSKAFVIDLGKYQINLNIGGLKQFNFANNIRV